jgi:hypothetical protein
MALENHTNIRERFYELIPQATAFAHDYARMMNPDKRVVKLRKTKPVLLYSYV